MNWQDASEIVFGLLLNNKINRNVVRPDLFMPPHNKGVEYIKEHNLPIEDLIERIGLDPVQTSLEAVRHLNGLGDKDWLSILETSKLKYDAGNKLEKLGKKLQYGEDVNVSIIKDLLTRMELGHGQDAFTALSDVERTEIPFKECGWKAIDEHLGGVPEVGLITLLGYAGTAKTTASIRFATSWVRKWKNEIVAVFTMEMLASEYSTRLDDIDNTLTEDEQKRLLIFDSPATPEKVINLASTIDNLGFVIVDYADYLCDGEINEANMSRVFMDLAKGTKLLRVPILLLAQPNRSYTGGIPRMNQVYMTSAAEKASWMFLSIYNPTLSSFYDDPDARTMQLRSGQAAIACWKVRGGFRKHQDKYPGAIVLQYRGKEGFSPTSYRPHWIHITQ